MKRLFTTILAIAVMAFVMPSCDLLETIFGAKNNGNGEDEPGQKNAVVQTLDPFDESYFGINVRVKVNADAAGDFTTAYAGICYSFSVAVPELNAEDCSFNMFYAEEFSGKTGTYESSIVDMVPGQEVYYRAWASYDDTVYYGEVKTGKCLTLVAETSQAVDLGLSVKWSGYNVGASKPEEPGNFYAWGETAPQEGTMAYSYGSYSYGPDPYTKYNTTDGKTRLDAEDDAASVVWGDGWRMPTAEEKYELLGNTDRIYYNYNGVEGIYFVSKINGKAIFFPFTGEMLSGTLAYETKIVGFWTSDLKSDDVTSARVACNRISGGGLLEWAGFDMDYMSPSYNLSAYRYFGFSVRGVK